MKTRNVGRPTPFDLGPYGPSTLVFRWTPAVPNAINTFQYTKPPTAIWTQWRESSLPRPAQQSCAHVEFEVSNGAPGLQHRLVQNDVRGRASGWRCRSRCANVASKTKQATYGDMQPLSAASAKAFNPHREGDVWGGGGNVSGDPTTAAHTSTGTHTMSL